MLALLSYGANAQDYCLQFNDTTVRVKYLDDATLDVMDGASTYTLEAWIYPTSTTVKNKVVLKRWYQYALTLYTDSLYSVEANDPDNGRRFYFTHYGSSNTFYNSIDNAITINEWTHIAVVCDGTNTKLYANGVDVSRPTNPAPLSLAVPSATDANFYLGYGGSSTAFPGYIDKVRVIKEAINPATFNPTVTGPAYTSNENTAVLFNLNEGINLTTLNEPSGTNADLQCFGTGCTGAPTWIDLSTIVSVEKLSVSNFSIYPNPVTQSRLLIAPKNNEVIKNIQMTDVSGKLVKLVNMNASEPVDLNVSDLSSGVYMLTVLSNNSNETHRIIIK